MHESRSPSNGGEGINPDMICFFEALAFMGAPGRRKISKSRQQTLLPSFRRNEDLSLVRITHAVTRVDKVGPSH